MDTIKAHLLSGKHTAAKARGKVTLLQTVLPRDTLQYNPVKDGKGVVICDFVRMMATADIPMSKVSKMQSFLKKHCVQGGWIPGETQLRRIYVPQVQHMLIQKLLFLLAAHRYFTAIRLP